MTYLVDIAALKARLAANQPAGLDLLELAELHDKLEDMSSLDSASLRPAGEPLADVRQRLEAIKARLGAPLADTVVVALYELCGLEAPAPPAPAAPGPRSRLSPLAERRWA